MLVLAVFSEIGVGAALPAQSVGLGGRQVVSLCFHTNEGLGVHGGCRRWCGERGVCGVYVRVPVKCRPTMMPHLLHVKVIPTTRGLMLLTRTTVPLRHTNLSSVAWSSVC